MYFPRSAQSGVMLEMIHRGVLMLAHGIPMITVVFGWKS